MDIARHIAKHVVRSGDVLTFPVAELARAGDEDLGAAAVDALVDYAWDVLEVREGLVLELTLPRLKAGDSSFNHANLPAQRPTRTYRHVQRR